jgi:Mg2+ and Co2+ transporter CorA
MGFMPQSSVSHSTVSAFYLNLKFCLCDRHSTQVHFATPITLNKSHRDPYKNQDAEKNQSDWLPLSLLMRKAWDTIFDGAAMWCRTALKSAPKVKNGGSEE